VDDEAVFDSLKSEIVIVHDKDIVNELIMVQAPLVNDEQIVSDYQKLSAKKG